MYYNHSQPSRKKHAVSFQSGTIWRLRGPDLVTMKNIYEVLRNKELDLARLRTEVDALRFVAPLLADRLAENSDEPDVTWPPLQRNKWPLKVGHPAPAYSDS